MLLRLRYIYRFRFHLEYAEAWFVYIQYSSRVDLAGITVVPVSLFVQNLSVLHLYPMC